MGKLQLPKKNTGKGQHLEKIDRITEMMEEAGYDPIQSMMRMVDGSDKLLKAYFRANPMDAFQVHKELAKYAAPQMRAIDVSGQVDNSVKVQIVHYHQGGEKADVKSIEGETLEDVDDTDTQKLAAKTLPT